MWQYTDNQSGNFLHSIRQQVLIDNVNEQPTTTAESAYNISGYGLRSRNVPLSSTTAEAIALSQQNGFPNPAIVAVPVTSAVRLPMSIDQRNRVFEFAGTSTSGRPMRLSTQSGYSFSHELLSQIGDHYIEIDTILNHHRNMLREGIQERQKKYWISLIPILEQMAMKHIQEKKAELENVNRRNSELEQKIFRLRSENQLLFNLANQNEALVSRLKATLEQVLTQNTAADAAPLPVIEGYSNTDGTPFPANNEQSFFKIEEAMSANNDKVRRRMVCRVCQEKEISILVLHCRHLCLCKECEMKVNVCPICNSSKEGSVEIFMP